MPGTAIDRFFEVRERELERARLATAERTTCLRLNRFDAEMRVVSCFDDAREREVWREACRVVDAMRAEARRRKVPPMRLITIMVPERGRVYRCCFAWEMNQLEQVGDVLLALFILRNRSIDTNERAYHVAFLARHSKTVADRDYWKTIRRGEIPITPLLEHIRQQTATETCNQHYSRREEPTLSGTVEEI